VHNQKRSLKIDRTPNIYLIIVLSIDRAHIEQEAFSAAQQEDLEALREELRVLKGDKIELTSELYATHQVCTECVSLLVVLFVCCSMCSCVCAYMVELTSDLYTEQTSLGDGGNGSACEIRPQNRFDERAIERFERQGRIR
jgi:hypothetical protein